MTYTIRPTNLLKLHFKDSSGKRSTNQYNIANTELDPSAGGASEIAGKAALLSEAALDTVEIIVGATNDAPGSPTTGPYCRGADKLNLTFRSASAFPVKLNVGAPNEASLMPDTVYVNPSSTAIAALITAMKTYACDESGDAIVSLQRGYRNRPSRRKHA